jgi:hypothetical protein
MQASIDGSRSAPPNPPSQIVVINKPVCLQQWHSARSILAAGRGWHAAQHRTDLGTTYAFDPLLERMKV